MVLWIPINKVPIFSNLLYYYYYCCYYCYIITIIIIIITIIIMIRVMCVSGHFCNTRLFSDSSFSVLCSKNFEVMKLAATLYDETNVDIHPFLTLNREKPKILSGIFFR